MDDTDDTEMIRRQMVMEVNANAGERADLAAKHGQVWDKDELTRDFVVLGFMAPFVAVVRRSDMKRGALMFQHSPRFYFDFVEG